MSFFSFSAPIRGRQAPSLHRRFIIGAALGGTVAIMLLAAGSSVLLGRLADRQGDARVSDAALRAQIGRAHV